MVEGRRVAESAERRGGSLGSEGNSHEYMILKVGVHMLHLWRVLCFSSRGQRSPQ